MAKRGLPWAQKQAKEDARILKGHRQRCANLETAYLRLKLARDQASGVTLSRDEVHALFTLDTAISSAAEGILDDRLGRGGVDDE